MITTVLRCAAFVMSVGMLPLAGQATEPAQSEDQLIELLQFDETIGIMREEGLRYGTELAQDMLPEGDTPAWQATVSRIYDEERMLSLISAKFRRELEQADLTPMVTYFQREEAREIVSLELAARRAFLARVVEKEAISRYDELEGDGDPIVDQIESIITDSDLVDFNVMGTLNSNLMFYSGLREGGYFELSEEEILADVWSQEDSARIDSERWLQAFLLFAYQPLDREILANYAAFYRTAEGRELNRAIFAAFDGMYAELSYLIGLAIADHMASEPL